MLGLRTSERQKVGMGGTRFDPGQHHPALTLRAAWPMDGKQGWVGMTIGFRHDASPALGGSATLSVTGRRRYEGAGWNQNAHPAQGIGGPYCSDSHRICVLFPQVDIIQVHGP